ncbi:MAG: TM2 domain-containing protein [Paludibacter sp.]|jgi:TM2 domain-containing membrane protein YozV|nr:TM2 domain-containing protein [Paludibacter sp.]
MEIINQNINQQPQESKRVIAGVLAIIFGSLGIHKFVLGYTAQGLILLGVAIVTFGIATAVTSIIGIIEGIVYLTKSDAEFVQTYQINKRKWF